MAGNGESSIAVLSKSDVVEAPFEVVSDSGQASDVQPPSSVSMTWYQSTGAATSMGEPAGNQLKPQRPLQEIVSSMQGNYNFLQDSEIDGKYCTVLFFCSSSNVVEVSVFDSLVKVVYISLSSRSLLPIITVKFVEQHPLYVMHLFIIAIFGEFLTTFFISYCSALFIQGGHGFSWSFSRSLH